MVVYEFDFKINRKNAEKFTDWLEQAPEFVKIKLFDAEKL